MSTNPYDNNYLKQVYTGGLSNINNKSNELWDYLKNSAAQNSQLSQDYSKTVNDYLSSIQSDKQAVTGRVDDLTGTIKADKALLHGKYDRLEDYQYNHNPYTSDIGKSILANFQWQGKNASDNAVADASAGNGGNIDSFAAANAARQQLSFDVAGHNAALNDFNTRAAGLQQTLRDMGNYNLGTYDAANRGIESIVNQNSAGYAASGKALDNLYNSNLASQASSGDAFNNYMSLLGFMGGQNQQVFSNDMLYNQQQFDNTQTSLNNQVNRDYIDSQITGTVPLQTMLRNSTYFDENGNLRNGGEGFDFAAEINRLTEQLKNTADTNERRKLENQIAQAQIARNYKIQTNPAYSSYMNTLESYTPQDSSYTTQTNADRAAQELLTKLGYDYGLESLKRELASNEKVSSANNSANMSRLMAQLGADASGNNSKMDLEYYKLNQQKDMFEQELAAKYGNPETTKPLFTLAQAQKEIEEGRVTQSAIDAVNYYHQDANAFEKYYLPAINEAKFNSVYNNISQGAAEYLDTIKNKNVNESELRNNIINNSGQYGISVNDAKEICGLYGFDTGWLDSYRDSNSKELSGN